MVTVAILMSTYNGEKYLSQQIDSILNQKEIDVHLFIRDDGSYDNTWKLLEEYKQKYEKINIISAKNVGVGNSFMNLLYSVPNMYDYYAFSDQDDIWEPNKIIEAIKMLCIRDEKLYASNQECIDKCGNSLGIRYSKNKDMHLSALSILNQNDLAGCTMVMKNDLFKQLTDIKNRPSASLLQNRIHDVWVAMVASIYGGILYDQRSFIKYRQHENNVVGANTRGIKKTIELKIKKIKDPNQRNGRSKLAKELVDKFPDYVKDEIIIASSDPDNFKNKYILLKSIPTIRKYTTESTIGLTIKILINLY